MRSTKDEATSPLRSPALRAHMTRLERFRKAGYGYLVAETILLAAFLVASWLLEKSSDPPPVGIPTALPLDYTIHLAVLGAATLACGSYGIWALDRGWVLGCFVFQFVMAGSLYVFTHEALTRVLALVLMCIVAAGGWLMWRVADVMQEIIHEAGEGLPVRGVFLELFSNTPRQLGRMIIDSKALSAILAVTLVVVSWASDFPFAFHSAFLGLSVLLSILPSAFALRKDSRALLMLVFAWTAWNAIVASTGAGMYLHYWFRPEEVLGREALANLTATATTDASDNATAVLDTSARRYELPHDQSWFQMATYIMMYTLVATEMAAAWAALRLETMLQDFENPRIASFGRHLDLCGRWEPRTVPFLKRSVYASGVVRLVFVAALIASAAVADFAPAREHQLVVAAIMIVSTVGLIYGAVKHNRGAVMVGALLSIMFLGNDVLFQVQVWSFEIVDSGRENKEFTWMSSVVNPILYVVELLVVWSGFLLSEALQDTDRYEGAIAKGSTSSDGTMSPLSGSSADTSSDTVGSESYDGLACDNSMAIMIEIGSTDSSCSAFV